MATHSSILAWKNPMGWGAWQATVHGITKSQTLLSHNTQIWDSWLVLLRIAYCRGKPSLINWPEVSEVKCSVRIAKETHKKEIQSKKELGFSLLKEESWIFPLKIGTEFKEFLLIIVIFSLFVNSFMEIKFTWYTIHPFKMYKSVFFFFLLYWKTLYSYHYNQL